MRTGQQAGSAVPLAAQAVSSDRPSAAPPPMADVESYVTKAEDKPKAGSAAGQPAADDDGAELTRDPAESAMASARISRGASTYRRLSASLFQPPDKPLTEEEPTGTEEETEGPATAETAVDEPVQQPAVARLSLSQQGQPPQGQEPRKGDDGDKYSHV